MKRITFAAAALLLGTSALAWAGKDVPAVAVDPGIAAVKPVDAAKTIAAPKTVEAASASWIADDQILVDTSAATTPQPAAADYPPCSPGPGDDHCIQLYERGVRAQLASWNRPTGGLADGSATDAMGGPYEPADTSLADAMGGASIPAEAGEFTGMGGPEEPVLAMNGDGAVDSALGEIAADEGAGTAYTGVGGPLEEVDTTSYPPCRPGPGDDRCIQLYERGVTGR